MIWQTGVNKGSNGTRNHINILGLWKSSLYNLINDLLTVRVFWIENFSPEFFSLTLDKISSLHSVKIVFVGDFNKLIIASAPCSFISSECKVWVALFTVFTDNLAIVELILDQEFLGILASRVNINLSESIVKGWLLDPLFVSCLKPGSQHTKLVSLFKVLDQFRNRANTDRKEKLLDITFFAVEIEQSTKDFWSG